MILGDSISVLEEDGPLIWALDDEALTRALLRDVLEQGGYRYAGFSRERELFDACESSAQWPDLLLLDWMLLGRSGHDVLRDWHQRFPHIPVIVVTAVAGESVLVNAFKAGASDVVRKPFDVTELLLRIQRQLLEQAERQASLDIHAMQARQLAFCMRLAHCARATECMELLARELDATHHTRLFCTLHDELVCGDEVLELSAMGEVWEHVMQGQSVWVDTLSGRSGSYIVPLLHKARLQGVIKRDAMQRHAQQEAHLEYLGTMSMLTMARLDGNTGTSHGMMAPSRAFLERIIEASPDAIVAADRSGEITLFNSAAERVLMWRREDALGDDVRRLYRDGVAYQVMARLKADEEGGPGRLSRHREVLLTQEREEIPVELSAALIMQGAEIVGTVGLFRDIRERIAMESRLEQAALDLEAHQEHAVMAQMAGATAHELNQPLTSMLNYIDVLKHHDTLLGEPRLSRAIQVLDRDAQRLAGMVKQIADITQYRTRAYVDDTRIVDLQQEDDS